LVSFKTGQRHVHQGTAAHNWRKHNLRDLYTAWTSNSCSAVFATALHETAFGYSFLSPALR
jgi:hypothetical protein